jgi:hypothetical protein
MYTNQPAQLYMSYGAIGCIFSMLQQKLPHPIWGNINLPRLACAGKESVNLLLPTHASRHSQGATNDVIILTNIKGPHANKYGVGNANAPIALSHRRRSITNKPHPPFERSNG